MSLMSHVDSEVGVGMDSPWTSMDAWTDGRTDGPWTTNKILQYW